MKKTFTKLMMAVIIMVPLLSLVAIPVQAATNDTIGGSVDLGVNDAEEIGLGNKAPKQIMVQVIRIALGFLGLIAVIIILIGGFKWMTAQGNDDKISEARKLIQAGIVGLVIILAAWGITFWLLDTIANNITR